MAQLVPSILENTKEAFWQTYNQEVKLPGVSRIQVDFGDGEFVPNKILPVSELDVLNPAIGWEAHLMLQRPKDFLDYQICGFKTVIVHYEAYENNESLKSVLAEIRKLGMKNGLAIKPDTDINVCKQFEGQVDQFLIMGVNPGFQGQKFIVATLERIQELRRLIPNAVIEVDGGINLENVRQAAQAGADLLILGSAITKAHNMQEAFEKIQNELNKK